MINDAPRLDRLTLPEKSRMNVRLLKGNLLYIPWLELQTELLMAYVPQKAVPVAEIDFSWIKDERERATFKRLRQTLENKGHPTYPNKSSDELYAETVIDLLISLHKRIPDKTNEHFYRLSDADAAGFLRFYPDSIKDVV